MTVIRRARDPQDQPIMDEGNSCGAPDPVLRIAKVGLNGYSDCNDIDTALRRTSRFLDSGCGLRSG